ncbi:MAG: RNA 3'-terminal phosphate cyclase [Desulfurococcales archaeon]|nr:RNA 3'-terminal phosphate cyclase [Desulfurococcales archaeon]
MSRGEAIVIDGSMGEGGGQILRTALAISAVTGRPVRVVNIRAKRRNPGLRPQHLTAVKALADITRARVKGAFVGSMEIEFWPGPVRGGRYTFDVGTAGSVSLVLQALLPALAYADSPVYVRISGGTDVPMSPSIDYMREVLSSLLARFSYLIRIRLLRRGHYPRGGGIVELEIDEPPGMLNPVDIVERGPINSLRGRSHAVRLPRHVAERQARAASRLIERELGIAPEIEIEWYKPERDPHLGPGSGITLWAITERSVLGSDALGARGKPAERVGEEAARGLLEDLKLGAAVDRHASDMLPVYMALARGVSRFTGAVLTSHAMTVFKLLKTIIDGFEFKVEGESPFKAVIHGVGLMR